MSAQKKPKDPADRVIQLGLKARTVGLVLQVLAAQPYNLSSAAIDEISKQYNRQRKEPKRKGG